MLLTGLAVATAQDSVKPPGTVLLGRLMEGNDRFVSGT